MLEGYDIIGDLHGQMAPLLALLKKLGYRQRDEGAWRYPGDTRKAVFVGDFVDRNPHALAIVATVRGMVEASSALAAMGNHEFNALCWATQDPDSPGEYLRRHNDHNTRQHAVFLGEAAEDETAYTRALEWFRHLPMWLDLGALRIVHAAWVPSLMERLGGRQDANGAWTNELLVDASHYHSPTWYAVEGLLKGLETRLPEGVSYLDSEGISRTRARLRWWLSHAPETLRQALLAGPVALGQVPDSPWQGNWPEVCGYPADAPPVFCGHYWLDGPCKPLAPNVACVDYSAARAGNKLVAYRWGGEARLTAENFVSVGS